jgi:predicted esterase
LKRLAEWRDQNSQRAGSIPPIFILSAENDEIIPPYLAGQLEKRGQDLGLDISRKEVTGAMHTEGPLKVDGREALVRFILDKTSEQ